jgi:hypothetical protein
MKEKLEQWNNGILEKTLTPIFHSSNISIFQADKEFFR